MAFPIARVQSVDKIADGLDGKLMRSEFEMSGLMSGHDTIETRIIAFSGIRIEHGWKGNCVRCILQARRTLNPEVIDETSRHCGWAHHMIMNTMGFNTYVFTTEAIHKDP